MSAGNAGHAAARAASASTDGAQSTSGAAVALDPACRPAIEASARAVDAIVARGEPVYGINTASASSPASRIEAADLRAAAAQHRAVARRRRRRADAARRRAADDGAEAREPGAGRLGRAAGYASPCWRRCWRRDLMPVVPCQGSVGASGDLAPLAHMAAAMIGVGEIDTPDGRMPAREALCAMPAWRRWRLGPRKAWRCSTARSSRPPMRSPRCSPSANLLRAALITGVLSTEAAKGSDAPFDARIHALRRHRGQIDCADALRRLMAGSAIRASHLVGDDRVQDPYCLRCQPQVMGAGLDTLRHVAGVLADEANGVSDNPLIFAEDGIALSGGNFHAEPVALAADMMALAICEIGSLAERRIAMLVDPALSRLPAFLTPKPGLNSGFMIPQVTAAALVSENKQRAAPASIDSIPTSANQEDHVSMAAHAARRLLPMAENLTQILAIELLAACQGCDFHAPLASSAPLERVRSLAACAGSAPRRRPLSGPRHRRGRRPRALRRGGGGGGHATAGGVGAMSVAAHGARFPLPVLHGERVRVRGGCLLRRRHMWPPLTRPSPRRRGEGVRAEFA